MNRKCFAWLHSSLLLILTVVGLCGCSNSSSSSKSNRTINSETSIDDLLTWNKEACSKNDFATAHMCVDELWNRCAGRYYLHGDKFEQASDILFTAESHFLIAHIDEDDARKRLVFLITETPQFGVKHAVGTYGGYGFDWESEAKSYQRYIGIYNQKCDKLLTLALGLEDENLSRRIIKLYQRDYIIKMTYPEGKYYTVVEENEDSRKQAILRFEEVFEQSY